MPFPNQPTRAFSKDEVLALNPNQNGVYGIFNASRWIYVGRGDIRDRVLRHVGGDIPCILKSVPTGWVAEVVVGDASAREKQLIMELKPMCNEKVG